MSTLVKWNPDAIVQGQSTIEHKRIVCECGELIADNFHDGQILSLNIKCHQCGKMHSFRDPLPGDVFPHSSVKIPDQEMGIGRPINMSGGTIFGEQAIDAIGQIWPSSQRTGLSIDNAGMDEVEEVFNAMSNNAMASHLRFVRASPTGSGDDFRYPVASAISLLRKKIASGPVILDDLEVSHALFTIKSVYGIFDQWRMHPRFGMLTEGLKGANNFWHTWATCELAKSFWAGGSQVTFGIAERPEQAVLDLYGRDRDGAKTYFEIKTVKSLLWPSSTSINNIDFDGIVRKLVKNSKDQLLKKNAVICVASPTFSREIPERIRDAAKSYFNRKRGSGNCAGIMCLGVEAMLINYSPPKKFSFGFPVLSEWAPNPYSNRPDPIAKKNTFLPLVPATAK